MKLPVQQFLHRQRGSIYSTLIIVALFGMFMTVSLKIAPSYLDNKIIRNTLEGIRANNDIEELSINEIRTQLQRTLITNNIRDFDATTVTLVRERDMEYIDISYESRVPLFYNIEAVVIFSDRFDKF